MKNIECLREQEVFEAVATERWPDRCSDELRTHVNGCAICSDVLEVTRAIHEDYATARIESRLPSAGLVWWRAELRARQEALRTAERPLTLAQAFGGACVAGAAVALMVQAWPLLSGWTPAVHWGWLLAAVAVVATLASVALYFVLSDE